MRFRPIFVVLLLATFALMAAAPAMASSGVPIVVAFTDAEDESGEAEAEVQPEVISELGVVPVVEAEPAEEAATDHAWTFRFLGPVVAAIGVFGLIGAVVYYAFRIRGRYQAAE